MFTTRVMDSLRVICIAVGAVAILLILLGIATVAFGAQSDEYVMMSRETFDQMVKMLKVCQGGRI